MTEIQYGVEGAGRRGDWCHYGDSEGLTKTEAEAYVRRFGGRVVQREVSDWEPAK